MEQPWRFDFNAPQQIAALRRAGTPPQRGVLQTE
jgi:hypothetical protein